eukprot:360090_1
MKLNNINQSISVPPIKIRTSMTTDIAHESLLATSPKPRCPLSPQSPVTPTLSAIKVGCGGKIIKYSIEKVLKNAGYTPLKELCATLQGSIWRVSKVSNNKKGRKRNYIIKVTKRSLHHKSVAECNGKQVNVSENIIKETAILRYLTSANKDYKT